MTDIVTILPARPARRRRRQLLAVAPSSRRRQLAELAGLASCFATAVAIALTPACLAWRGLDVDLALAILGGLCAVPAILGTRERGE